MKITKILPKFSVECYIRVKIKTKLAKVCSNYFLTASNKLLERIFVGCELK